MRYHRCDVTETEDATHRLTLTLEAFDEDGEPIPGEDHTIVLDAGKSVAERVKAGDLYGLGLLVPRKNRPKDPDPKPRSTRRGANGAAVAAALPANSPEA